MMAGVQKRKIRWAISLFLVMLYFFALPAQAQYGGGSGEPNDPYLIYTAEQMNAIGTEPNDWGKHFKLMVDIDLSRFTGTDFSIIGTDYDNPFIGVLDGHGHTISNFVYTSTDTNYIGLFGYVGTWGKEAVIKDLGLIEPNIDAGTGNYVGSLVGWLSDGTITGCYVEGGIVSGDWRVGGLVGALNFGTITNCYSTASVTGRENVGGLVGSNGGSITISYSTSPVSGSGYVGGLAGYNSGNMTACYSTGAVTGRHHVGGLVGRNWGAVTVCYSNGTVSGENNVGGLVGGNHGDVTHCYSTSPVSGSGYVGGLVGSGSDVTASFWDIQTSGQKTSASGTGKTTAEMQTANTFLEAGWDFADETENGTDDIWWIDEGHDYPTLVHKLSVFSPHPQDGATDVIQPVVLNWLPGGSGVYHDVYFGENKEAVFNATSESRGIYYGRLPVEVTIYDPGKLELGKTYYWRIDEVNETNPNSPWKGNVWSLVIANFLVVDDFEGYNDLDPEHPESNRIWMVWIDGYDSKTNGSIVGSSSIKERLLWIVIFHFGKRSMCMYYDNSSQVSYSEATANVVNLAIEQDWTIEGVAVLSLWFKGDTSNATEPMYVALANSDGTSAAVYHDNPNSAQIEEWTEWTIDLTKFSDQGVDLTNINTISIGFGDKDNTQLGGSGEIWFDDIRLYRPTPEPAL